MKNDFYEKERQKAVAEDFFLKELPGYLYGLGTKAVEQVDLGLNQIIQEMLAHDYQMAEVGYPSVVSDIEVYCDSGTYEDFTIYLIEINMDEISRIVRAYIVVNKTVGDVMYSGTCKYYIIIEEDGPHHWAHVDEFGMLHMSLEENEYMGFETDLIMEDFFERYY